MDIGFETIGNATLICYDRGPVLVTDPWLDGTAYFGSWTTSHEIPPKQMAAIEAAPFVWVSHGHPDHLSVRSLRRLRDKRILLPDHAAGRIATYLRGQGFDVTVLTDRVWNHLSDQIAVLSIADYNQDGILLADIGGRLVVNLNDASDHGWRRFIRSVVERYPMSILMRLSGLGDADMINLFDEDGRRVVPAPEARGHVTWDASANSSGGRVGEGITRMMRELGASRFVPFSSMHRYQRADSVWANAYTTPLERYSDGFDPQTGDLLPAFVQYDCSSDRFGALDPPRRQPVVRQPSDFGDDWAAELEPSDAAVVEGYFRRISHLERHFDFINVVVGGRDNVIALASRGFRRGLTFEVPRTSLMIAVQNEIFDDLLIGNFMRTTIHGGASLYPNFTPYVARYADNGGAKSREELRDYFRVYRRRAPLDYLRHRIEQHSRHLVRTLMPMDSAIYRVARDGYHRVRGF